MGKMWNICKNSLQLPKRSAAFSLNRVGMDLIVFYMFILLALSSVPDLVEQMQTNIKQVKIQTFFFLIFFFIFYYLISVFVVFMLISVIAYFGSWIARLTKRKLRYAILWKVTACIMTIPIIIFTVLSFFYPLGTFF